METGKIELNESKKHNLGIEILRFLLCFSVVAGHCGYRGSGKITNILMAGFQWQHVLTFCLLSFYLTSKYYFNFDWNNFKKRIFRLVYPMVVWAFIYWIILITSDYLFKWNSSKGISGLVWQLLTGHSINSALWFQVVILYLSVLFIIISKTKISKKLYYVILSILLAGGYLFQYTGWNYNLFGNLRYELKYPLGRFSEMLPIACVGIMLPHFKDDLKTSKTMRWFLFIILLLLIYNFVYFLQKIKMPVNHFDYSGIHSLPVSIIRLYAFLLFPAFLLPNTLQQILKIVTKYTMGIYCLHLLIVRYCGMIFDNIKKINIDIPNEKLFFTIITYMLCWLLCHAMYLTKNKYLKALIV